MTCHECLQDLPEEEFVSHEAWMGFRDEEPKRLCEGCFQLIPVHVLDTMQSLMWEIDDMAIGKQRMVADFIRLRGVAITVLPWEYKEAQLMTMLDGMVKC